MSRVQRSYTTRRALAVIVLAASSFLTGQKVYEYSADPSGEKDCLPLFSDSAGARSTPDRTDRIEVKAPVPAPPWAHQGGTINDASCLNRTPIYGVVRVTAAEDIASALLFAGAHDLKVSIAGVRHSMGGQAFFKDAVVLDMTTFNALSLDEHSKILTVQSGATWHDIQNFLHPKYAVKAMQSTDIFTVGGSISVNAHGMDHRVGAIGKTIRSMRLMLPDGSIQRLSRTDNQELFNLVIGGYGLFGIILDVELDVTDNVIYRPGRRIIEQTAFPDLFATELAHQQELGLIYGHLSTAPQSFLREMILYTYAETASTGAEIPALTEVSHTKLRRLVINLSKRGSLPMRLKWFAEKRIEPKLESCSVTRNQAMKDGEACLVSRNEPMHDSVKYLNNNLKRETDILQEYFIPRDRFVTFVDGLGRILGENRTNLLNASVRVVHQEDNALNYAPTDMFSIVLYINQDTTDEGNERMGNVTRQIIDLTIGLDGTFFLPYQLHFTPGQLQRAYPGITAFFEAKKRYDPQLVLTNTFYEKYSKSVR